MARLVALVLSAAERSELMALTRRRKTGQALALRARIVLLCAEGAMMVLRSTGLLRVETDASNRFVIPAALARPTAYAVGALAAFWMIERVAGFAAWA